MGIVVIGTVFVDIKGFPEDIYILPVLFVNPVFSATFVINSDLFTLSSLINQFG